MVAARTLLGLHSARPGAAFTADDDVQNNRHPACDALGQLANHLSELDVPVLRPHAELFRWTETFQVDHASARANAIAVGPNGRFIYSHSSAGLRKIGTGAATPSAAVCTAEKITPTNGFICVASKGNYTYGEPISWPMVEVVRCEDLTRLDPIRLGDDLSWRRGYHIDPMVSDGRYIYLIRVDKQSKSASRGGASPRKRRFLSVTSTIHLSAVTTLFQTTIPSSSKQPKWPRAWATATLNATVSSPRDAATWTPTARFCMAARSRRRTVRRAKPRSRAIHCSRP